MWVILVIIMVVYALKNVKIFMFYRIHQNNAQIHAIILFKHKMMVIFYAKQRVIIFMSCRILLII